MLMLNVKQVAVGQNNGYFIKESQSETFFPGRRADVFYQNEKVGTFGIVHPQVLEYFEIGAPCSALELNVEPFL
jgi:phenylalanyl-tRNA synthetase beta chain